MPSIKFSHSYTKLAGATTATLLAVIPVRLEDLPRVFLAYDTDDGLYKLPETGEYLMLMFRRAGGLFTTLRRNVPRKQDYYWSLIGKSFDLVVPSSPAWPPCPCGAGKTVLRQHRAQDPGDVDPWNVECDACSECGPDSGTKEQAIAGWIKHLKGKKP